PAVSSCLFYCSGGPRGLRSFPTRRSSDLRARQHSVDDRRPRAVGRLLPCVGQAEGPGHNQSDAQEGRDLQPFAEERYGQGRRDQDRKSTRLNSSHVKTSYAVSCLKKNTTT